MKRLIFIFLLFPFFLNAQTLVDSDDVINKYGATGDTLNLNDELSDTYYVKDFSLDSELNWDVDSVGGYTKVITQFYGSYDNSVWILIDTDTVAGASGTVVQQSGTYLYPYLKAYSKAIDSVQTSRYKYNLVINKN